MRFISHNGALEFCNFIVYDKINMNAILCVFISSERV